MVKGTRCQCTRNKSACQNTSVILHGKASAGALDFQIMEIERLWGQDPGWFALLPKDEKVRILAWYQVRVSGGKAKVHKR